MDGLNALGLSVHDEYSGFGKRFEEKLRDIACREVEIEMFRKYSEVYGYVFYVVQCST